MELETAIYYTTKVVEYAYWSVDVVLETISHYIPKKSQTISTCKACIHDARVPNSNLMTEYFTAAKQVFQTFNSELSVGGANPIDQTTFLKNNTIVNIPMVFHLLDPKLKSNDTKFYENLIKNSIVKTLNQDYNRNYSNFKDSYISMVNNLFKDSDVSKKNFYLQCSERLSKLKNVTWNFSLHKIIVKPVSGLDIDNDTEQIYKSTDVVDPENFLNIIIAPGNSILGISVFPFWDRNSQSISKIADNLKYRNAVLINTSVFLGGTPPYNLYRTFTHEIGHWAGLLHPFDNSSYMSDEIKKYNLDKLDFDKSTVKIGDIDQDRVGDLIADTASQSDPVYGTVYDSFVKVRNWINGKYVTTNIRNTPYSKIFEKNTYIPNFYNFMDYTDDGQMCFFTHLQHLHMLYILKVFRPNFLKTT